MFAGTDAPPVIRHFHTFGCPTYILDNSLAAGKSIPKWHRRARLGVYLGRSPNHAQSVALVMSLSTGLVSPQFHLKFDDLFETVKGEATFPNNWKSATHFRKATQARKEKASDPVRPTRTEVADRHDTQATSDEATENETPASDENIDQAVDTATDTRAARQATRATDGAEVAPGEGTQEVRR